MQDSCTSQRAIAAVGTLNSRFSFHNFMTQRAHVCLPVRLSVKCFRGKSLQKKLLRILKPSLLICLQHRVTETLTRWRKVF